MAIVLTDDEFVVLDESQGLQDTGVSGTNEDNDDNDIVYTDLPAAFATRLFDAAQLNLSSAFAQANGAAQNDFISLTEGSTLTGFVMSSGDPLLAYDAGATDPTTGVLAGFTTVDGEAIYLFADEASGLGASMFLGVDANGDIVFAGYLEADGTISTVQFEAITNPDSGNHDDPVDLGGLLDVGASGTIDFDFDDLPSSNNLFATLGASPDGPAIVIFGADIQLQADGTPTNTSDMMFMSQAGPNATIGMNNQMFNPGDAAFFAYVNDVNADFLSGWEPNGLTGTEADDADNALYTGGTLDVTAAQFTIAQIQGNGTGSMTLTTYLGAADTARDLLTGPTDGATSPNIIAVNVTIGGNTTTFDSDADPAVSGFDVSGLGTATVTLTGVDDGYLIEFVTDSEHNRVKIEGTAGKFDIGGFTITEGTFVHEPVGDRIVFEDDGPSVGDGEGTAALTVDDSDFLTDDSGSYANLFDVDFGTDGGKDSDNDGTVDADAVTYSLSIGAGDSGLIDTLTGDTVVLSMDGAAVVGMVGTEEVFRITVDVNTGEVTLDQSRAVVHDDPDDDEESGSPAQLASADLIALTATATDDDGDTADHTVGIGDTFNFEDDGPSITRNEEEVPALTVDDSDFTTNDSADFSVLFDTAFGNDGPLDADDNDVADPGAVTYELGINAGASGLTDTLTGDAVVLSTDGTAVVGMVGTEEVFRITVDAETGEVTLDQSRAVVHDDPDDDEESDSPAQLAAANLVTLTAVAVDGDLDHDDAVADIGLAFNFEDDGPSIDRNLVEVPDLTVDESAFGSVFADFSSLFTTAFGNDGPKDTDDNDIADDDAITYAVTISNAGDDTGLIDSLTGEAVVLDVDGLDVIGVTEIGGLEVFRVSADGETGVVTLTQSRAVKHDDPDDPDESSSPASFTSTNLVSLVATAYDGDGDHDSATLDISATFLFEDDGPSIGPISGGMVDFVNGDTVSNLLGAVPGADGANARITDFTESFDFGFGSVVGVQEDDQTVTYYEDENGNGTIDTGEDNAFFRLSLDTSDGDPANWSYLFETLADPAPVSIDFDFDELPSGANLFGVVGESDTDPAILVFGKKVVINAAGNYTNKSDVIHTSQGGTGATIGVNNQMFDPGDGAYFVYIDDPVANYLSGVPGGLSSTEADDADNVQYTGGTVDVTTASITISQMQGNKGATMKLTTFLGTAEQGRDMVLTPDGTSPNIVTVWVIKPDGTVYEFDADSDPAIGFVDVTGLGTTSVVVSGLSKGYTVEWDTDTLHNRVLVEGVAGKFDVGKFSIGEPGVTPDAELDFQVTIEDFDTFGDTEVADFTIGIDGDLDGVITI